MWSLQQKSGCQVWCASIWGSKIRGIANVLWHAQGDWIELELRHFTRELPLSNLPLGGWVFFGGAEGPIQGPEGILEQRWIEINPYLERLTFAIATSYPEIPWSCPCLSGQHHFRVAIETPDGWSDWSPVAPRRVRAKQEEMIGFIKKNGKTAYCKSGDRVWGDYSIHEPPAAPLLFKDASAVS